MSKAQANKNLSIRAANADDAELLWHWANDASVRERSFNQEPIVWEAHLEWLSRRLASPDTKFYLLSRGYTDYETLREGLDKVLKEIA